MVWRVNSKIVGVVARLLPEVGFACLARGYRPLFGALVMIFALTMTSVAAGQTAARGGGTPPVDYLIAQFQQSVADGEHEKATEKMLFFARQKRRDQDSRLKLFLALTEQAIETDNHPSYLALIDAAKNINPGFGHFLQLHHFNYQPAKLAIVESLIWLAKNNSHHVDDISVRFLWRVYHFIDETDPDKTFELLESLFDYGYPREYAALSIDTMYLELIRRYLQVDNIDRAKRVLQTAITDLEVYFDIWHDKRYAELWPLIEDEGMFDPQAIIQRNLQLAFDYLENDQSKTWNQWIETKTHIVRLYRSKGDYEAAIEFAKSAIEEVPDSVKNEDKFFWLQQQLVHVYDDAGYWQRAKDLNGAILNKDIENHPILVNGHINFAVSLLENRELARAEILANKIITDFADYTSDYGEYFAKAVLTCVLSQTGKRRQARQILNQMLSDASINYYASTRAALCLQDVESTRRLYLERLADPKERAETLSYLSHYSNAVGPIKNQQLKLFRDSVINQDSLRELINQYGRIRSWNLPSGYWDGL